MTKQMNPTLDVWTTKHKKKKKFSQDANHLARNHYLLELWLLELMAVQTKKTEVDSAKHCKCGKEMWMLQCSVLLLYHFHYIV